MIFGPGALEPLPRLSVELDGSVEIWAKREDCNSGLTYGDNETRKLEYLVPDARQQGCDNLVSIGGIQSNHTRQVAAVAAKTGFRCHLIQVTWVDWQGPHYHELGNILLSRIMDAETEISKEPFGIGLKESWEAALEGLRAEGARPYPIPAGASDHPWAASAMPPSPRRCWARSARWVLPSTIWWWRPAPAARKPESSRAWPRSAARSR